mgnify:CR=1 FL=1
MRKIKFEGTIEERLDRIEKALEWMILVSEVDHGIISNYKAIKEVSKLRNRLDYGIVLTKK